MTREFCLFFFLVYPFYLFFRFTFYIVCCSERRMKFQTYFLLLGSVFPLIIYILFNLMEISISIKTTTTTTTATTTVASIELQVETILRLQSTAKRNCHSIYFFRIRTVLYLYLENLLLFFLQTNWRAAAKVPLRG